VCVCVCVCVCMGVMCTQIGTVTERHRKDRPRDRPREG
jgi:hypothetical protein